eukprot:21947-Rhodomonas_salina.1
MGTRRHGRGRMVVYVPTGLSTLLQSRDWTRVGWLFWRGRNVVLLRFRNAHPRIGQSAYLGPD